MIYTQRLNCVNLKRKIIFTIVIDFDMKKKNNLYLWIHVMCVYIDRLRELSIILILYHLGKL